MFKKLIIILLFSMITNSVNAEMLYENNFSTNVPIISVEKSKIDKQEIQSIIQDGTAIAVPIFCYSYKNAKYISKGIHFGITKGMIKGAKHFKICKKHPNITAVFIAGSYFLIWDVIIEKQADIPALMADFSAAATEMNFIDNK